MPWKRFLPFVLIAVSAVAVYSSSLRNGFVIWDDDSLVYENPLTQEVSVKNITGAFTSYDPELYVPLTIMSFQMEHALFGFQPFYYHLDNLLLHIVNGMLVFLLLQRFGLKRTTAFIGALLFVVHPLNTEAAAWISARKDVLSAAFILGSLLAWRQRQWLSVLLFLLALLSKPVAIVVPAILLLMDWYEDRKLRKDDVQVYAPFLLLSILFLSIGLFGKAQNISSLTALQTLLLAAKSIVFSLQKFLWPAPLSSIYLQTTPITPASAEFLIPLLLGTLGAVGAFILKRWKGPLFTVGFFLLLLAPSFSNFSREGSLYYFSDRYVYLAQIAILLLLGEILERLPRRSLWIAAIPLVFLGSIAHARSLVWKDSETLYRDALVMNERSVTMHYNLGLLEQERGNVQAATAEYDRVLELNPLHAKTLTNMGVLAKDRGDSTTALDYFRRAMAADPLYPEARNNIGSVYMDQVKIDDAIVEFQAAIALDDSFPQAHVNLASAYGKKGMYEEALREYRIAVELEPRLLQEHPEIREALEKF